CRGIFQCKLSEHFTVNSGIFSFNERAWKEILRVLAARGSGRFFSFPLREPLAMAPGGRNGPQRVVVNKVRIFHVVIEVAAAAVCLAIDFHC
ncbi:hypothetical protein LCGC14_2580970, partial [marine sediment metagenome]